MCKARRGNVHAAILKPMGMLQISKNGESLISYLWNLTRWCI